MRRVKTEPCRSAVAACLAVVVLLAAACAAPSQDESAPGAAVTVFEGARLITGDTTPAVDDAVFVVEGTRFVHVGRQGEVNIPAGATRVNLTGKTVIPAIIDTHVHTSHERAPLIEDLERRAYYGVGAIMSLGQDPGDLAFQIRAETIPNAARFRTAGRGITGPEPGRTDIPYWVTSEAEVRTAVQELAARKVDIVKIWVDDRNGMYTKLSPALYGTAIDEAHQHGLRVTAHIFALDDAKGLLRAGVDAFAHGVRDRDIDEEFVVLIKQHPNVVLVPNLPDRGIAADLGWLQDTVPAAELQKLQAAATDRPDVQKVFAIQARNLARLNAVGVTIALGSDGNSPWGPHIEMADMVAAGMTPAQVIVAATRNSAALLGLTDAGTVAVGNRADFVVLEANPLDDITNTRRIADVYLAGVAVDRAALRARWPGPSAP